MIKYLKWIIGIPLVLIIVVFAHYTLPGRDVVRIVGTDVKRMDIGSSSWFWAAPDAGTNPNWTRDVRFINTVWPDGKPRVYRNEDTDWGWPPYFKFDSSNITAQAQDLAKKEDEVWIAVTHYGWRIELFTIFPNAIDIEEVEGPDVLLIPWFNIIFILVLSALALLVLRTMSLFKKKRIDPVVEGIDDFMDDVGENAEQAKANAQQRANEATSGFRRWLKRWFG
ncbi:DUF1523 family protein [Roseibium porphyridii]|uniref:DUF1523 family protein n=1 Tax=Roseibium porphyridii TaxID=2866279 RepID=A0ABY8F6N5_9HYPH|nr:MULTISPECIES: DUF1523 family protein [Stappiaceae]QFT30375.1 hypothetical protein FIV00_07815 [Labrenzia sp. THAF82]WFE91021.1 DUF1523 family protein [Roseibium sp. KMA01]